MAWGIVRGLSRYPMQNSSRPREREKSEGFPTPMKYCTTYPGHLVPSSTPAPCQTVPPVYIRTPAPLQRFSNDAPISTFCRVTEESNSTPLLQHHRKSFDQLSTWIELSTPIIEDFQVVVHHGPMTALPLT